MGRAGRLLLHCKPSACIHTLGPHSANALVCVALGSAGPALPQLNQSVNALPLHCTGRQTSRTTFSPRACSRALRAARRHSSRSAVASGHRPRVAAAARQASSSSSASSTVVAGA